MNINTFSQSTNLYPASFNVETILNEVDHIQIPPPNIELIIEEDSENEKNGQMMRIGRLLPLNINMQNSGTWDDIDNDTQIWRVRISSEGAKSCALHFDKFIIPEKAELFVYDVEKNSVFGPYDNSDNLKQQEYAIGVIQSNDVIIEYIAPKNIDKKGVEIELSAYSYIYIGEDLFDTNSAKNTGFGASDACNVNVNCSEGENWRDEQKGVAHIYCVDGWYAGYCSGTVINNTSNDRTPYFLTADHCAETSTASDFNQWIFSFNYESKSCQNPYINPAKQSVTGCTKLSSGPNHGGSDFLLLELSTTPEELKEIGVVYNGWRNTPETSGSGVSIHHPSGDIKKISTYKTYITTSTYQSVEAVGATNAHWRVIWSQTENGHGVTEGGSSGSPIFDLNRLVIGRLTVGSSYCDYPTRPDYYGKLSYHWESNGTSSDRQLKTWLDPNNTGAQTCAMLDPNAHVANIEIDNNSNIGVNNIYVYPNPTSGFINVSIPTNNAKLRMLDINGNCVKILEIKSEDTRIDISDLSKGIYFVEIEMNNIKDTIKISLN